MVSGEDEHPGTDQLISDVSGRAGIPRTRCDACSLGKDVVAAIGDLTQLLDGFVEVAAFSLQLVNRRLASKPCL
jgi:hypothetical protein